MASNHGSNPTVAHNAPKPRKRRSIFSFVPGVKSVMALGYYLRDSKVPLRHRLLLLAALIYILSPFDLIPEALLGPLGLTDDAAVLIGILKFLYSKELAPYKDRAQRRMQDKAQAE